MFGLEPGNYRIRYRSVFYGQGKRTQICYLRVTYKGGKKYFQVNEGIPEEVTEEGESMELNRFEVIDEVDEPIAIYKPLITVTFQDNKGYHIEMKANTLQGLEHVFNEFPRLKKALEL